MPALCLRISQLTLIIPLNTIFCWNYFQFGILYGFCWVFGVAPCVFYSRHDTTRHDATNSTAKRSKKYSYIIVLLDTHSSKWLNSRDDNSLAHFVSPSFSPSLSVSHFRFRNFYSCTQILKNKIEIAFNWICVRCACVIYFVRRRSTTSAPNCMDTERTRDGENENFQIVSKLKIQFEIVGAIARAIPRDAGHGRGGEWSE